jgi:glycosyltransferase involved in cell wall biosynthesis
MTFKQHITMNGEVILYRGTPDLDRLDQLSMGCGDLWHSGCDQGLRNGFMEIAYQTAIFFWYVKDFENLEVCASWRINPDAFAVRQSVWEQLGGFQTDYESPLTAAFDFGYNALRLQGAMILHVKGLFGPQKAVQTKISTADRYAFFRKNFKLQHSLYMIYRSGFWKPAEWLAFFKARRFTMRNDLPILKPRQLNPLQDALTVSYIIPTMGRQEYALQLLSDLAAQTFLPTQVVVVDATAKELRNEALYDSAQYPFRLDVIWQTSKGSCRARNEAIEICSGDYIAFGDDDIRIGPDFIENHLRFLQTYGSEACNGLDIRADHHTDGLPELASKLAAMGTSRWRAGAAQLMSNSNAFVSRSRVLQLGGNDINYGGGYGEDNDFGLALTKLGVLFLQNPFAVNLHLKPPAGGYRVWGDQAKVMGKMRKVQPWELDTPVKKIKPVPSPTLMYYFHKQFGADLVTEYRHKYFFLYFFKCRIRQLPKKLLHYPLRHLQFNKSVFYAKKLLAIGPRIR